MRLLKLVELLLSAQGGMCTFFIKVLSEDTAVDLKYLYCDSKNPHLAVNALGSQFQIEESFLIIVDTAIPRKVELPLMKVARPQEKASPGFSVDAQNYVLFNGSRDNWLTCKTFNGHFDDAYCVYIENPYQYQQARQYCTPVLLTAVGIPQ
ncbi:hypothetical protein TRICI_000448 [Trichomonascus ciferrii]|uniref:Uncharacterized protein n=1 Tax=Trichomonascus ciferrii TaxID=44093 RepID=A0A642VDG5_9ASCO|nr:hypothetical protein TRICI_000448 [Trichomonascus ciferrii]